MTKQEIINYMYENHVQGDFKIEEMAEDLAHHQWVHVSERLPEKKSDVLVTISDGFNPFVDTDLWDSSRFFCYGNHRVKAWMPLPEPWKEEEE